MVAEPNASPVRPGDARERMQRVRVGLTGLAAVILIVALAAAIGNGVRRNASAERSTAPAEVAAQAQVKADNAIDPDAEPLAQLGVAPGGTEPSDGAPPPVRPTR